MIYIVKLGNRIHDELVSYLGTWNLRTRRNDLLQVYVLQMPCTSHQGY